MSAQAQWPEFFDFDQAKCLRLDALELEFDDHREVFVELKSIVLYEATDCVCFTACFEAPYEPPRSVTVRVPANTTARTDIMKLFPHLTMY